MKKLNTLWIVLFAFFAMNLTMMALPNLKIQVGDTKVNGGVNDDLQIHGVVQNLSTSISVTTLLKVYLKERINGQSLSICWGEQCLPPIEDIGLTQFEEEVTIQSLGNSGYKFHCTIDQGGKIGDMLATFVFYDKDNPNDSAAFTTRVHIGATDVESKTNNILTLSPNPAIDNLNIKLTDKATNVRIYNIAGTLLNSINVQSGTHNLNVNISSFETGVYFVNIVSEDGTLKTHRFVVSK